MSTVTDQTTRTTAIPAQAPERPEQIAGAGRPVARWVLASDARLTCVWELQG